MEMLYKTCDECQLRKVRCINTPKSDAQGCDNCVKRGSACHFSRRKRQKRVRPSPGKTEPDKQEEVTPTTRTAHSEVQSIKRAESTEKQLNPDNAPLLIDQQSLSEEVPKAYVDMVFRGYCSNSKGSTEGSLVKSHNIYVGSSGLAFFSESRIDSITTRLGHNKFREVMESIAYSVRSFTEPSQAPKNHDTYCKDLPGSVKMSAELTASYIEAFFTFAHPLYPFLDRDQFEVKIFGHDEESMFNASPSLFALYYAVLAIGCQYEGGDSFKSDSCIAHQLFQVSISCLSRLVMRTEGLLSLQAIVAMAIFAQSASCIQYANMLITEAARMTVYLRYNRPVRNGEDATQCARAFWVVYMMEKFSSFVCYRSSMINDQDIGVAFPGNLDALWGSFDYFLAMARFARLLSRTYESLFTASASTLGHEAIHSTIGKLIGEVEGWKSTIPRLFNPDHPFKPTDFKDSLGLTASLRLRYHYYSAIMALSRLGLLTYTAKAQNPAKYRELAIDAARKVIELTTHIDIHLSMPNWFLVVMPLSACFVLFDFVIHNPIHAETSKCLALLGIATGYFNRLEYISDGVIESSPVSEMAKIARQFISSRKNAADLPATQPTDLPPRTARFDDIIDQNDHWGTIEHGVPQDHPSPSKFDDMLQSLDLNSFWEISW